MSDFIHYQLLKSTLIAAATEYLKKYNEDRPDAISILRAKNILTLLDDQLGLKLPDSLAAKASHQNDLKTLLLVTAAILASSSKILVSILISKWFTIAIDQNGQVTSLGSTVFVDSEKTRQYVTTQIPRSYLLFTPEIPTREIAQYFITIDLKTYGVASPNLEVLNQFLETALLANRMNSSVVFDRRLYMVEEIPKQAEQIEEKKCLVM